MSQPHQQVTSLSPVSLPETPSRHPVIDLSAADSVVEIDLTGGSVPILSFDEGLLGASPRQRCLKRVIDLIVASVALFLLSPVFLVTALLIKLTSKGPIFFGQTRVGEGGCRFRFLKFRTMYVDAETRRHDLVAFNEVGGPVFKIKADPRITQVGRVLRRLSIDELPQLVHVISGDMSLVGPRPPIPDEVQNYNWQQLQRLLVKPGLTCIWQVSGRSDLDFETWVEMDVDYIRGWTPAVDLELLARTVPAVLSGRGAY